MAEYRHQRDAATPELLLRRVLGLAAWATLGLLAGFALIHQAVTTRYWRPPLPRFQEIVREVEADPAIDLLFFGPSDMMTDIDPRVFDARAGELGHPFHSYN